MRANDGLQSPRAVFVACLGRIFSVQEIKTQRKGLQQGAVNRAAESCPHATLFNCARLVMFGIIGIISARVDESYFH